MTARLGNLSCWWRCVGLVLATLAFVSRAHAQTDKPTTNAALPIIKAHSQLEFAVYKGDALTVEVQAEGEGIEAKWVRTRDTFCRALICEIDTSDWSLGTHKVVFVVFNGKGSLFLRYKVRVLASPAGRKPGRVKPELVTTAGSTSIETVADSDMVVRTMTGRGYSYHRRKVQVVGPTPRNLEWAEKLRTQEGSALQFGRNGSDWHAIGPKSAVYLLATEGGRRAIVLKSGSVRSRQVQAAAPRWSIVVEDGGLQVDTDEYGDVLVTRNKDQSATVTVLRGHARVVMRGKDEKSVGSGATTMTLPHGSEATFKAGENFAPPVLLPRAKRVGKLVGQTSPEYAPGRKIAAEHPGASLLGGKLPKKLSDAVSLANDAIARDDFFVAIEALQLFEADVLKDADASLAYGTALRGVFLYDAAAKYLEEAAKLAEADPRAPFQLGLMYLAAGEFDRAIEQFGVAEDRDYPGTQELDYYLGVAEYRKASPIAAKSHFTYALWHPDDEQRTESARDFYQRLHQDGWLDLRFGLKLLYDTNVLRGSDTAIKAAGIDKNKSPGYRGGAGFTVFPYRGDFGYFALGFDGAMSGWTEAALKDLGTTEQVLTLGFGLKFGGEPGAPALVAIDAIGIAGTIAVGKERSNDQIGSIVSLGSPALWGLKLSSDSRLNSDPLPARADVYDPIMEEMVGATDRSNRRRAYILGLTPLAPAPGAFDLGLAVASAKVTFSGALREEEHYDELDVDVGTGYAPSLRSRYGLKLSQMTRSFKDSADGRKDSRLSVGLDWKYFYTTSLSHLIELTVDQHKSTRDENSYGRQMFAYGLNLVF